VLAASNIEEDGGLVREDLFFNADGGSIHRVVNIGQVILSGSLSDSSELVVHRTMAQANPSLVSSQVRHRDATQMGADGRAHQDAGVTGIGERGNWSLIEEGGIRKGASLLNLRCCQSSNENKFSVPRGLQDLTRGQLWDIEFLVRISDVPGSSDHLMIKTGDNCLHSEHIGWNNETLEHVDLSSLDFVVLVLLVPQSVLIEPVINLGLGVDGISEVGWSRGSNPELRFFSAEHIIDQLLVLSLVVFLDNTEVPASLA
jgi:hypothetical protein